MLKFLFSFLIFNVFLINLNSQTTLKFKFQEGSIFRVEAKDEQDLYINDKFNNKTFTTMQISTKVKNVNNDWAELQSFFRVIKNSLSLNGAVLEEERESIYKQNIYGDYIISDIYKRPSVRGIPKFPKAELNIDDKWNAIAEEYIEGESFNIEDFKVPINVEYVYKGKISLEDKEYDLIYAKYNSSYTIQNIVFKQKVYQTIYFDAEMGHTYKYRDNYEFIIDDSFDKITLKGNSSGKVIKVELPGIEEVESLVKNLIIDEKLEDIVVERTEKGILLTLEDIKFRSNSYQLMPSEYSKLEKISKILKLLKDNNVLIEGHTAYFGTEEERQILSQQRAGVVSNYFIKNKIKEKNQILYKGWGALKPKYDPNTIEGARKNRRVEITILNN